MDTSLGRVGALMCWYASRLFSLLVLPLFLTFFLLLFDREHVQPLLTHTMGMMHEQVHCASWPSFSPIAPHHSLSATANVSSRLFLSFANLARALTLGFDIFSTLQTSPTRSRPPPSSSCRPPSSRSRTSTSSSTGTKAFERSSPREEEGR